MEPHNLVLDERREVPGHDRGIRKIWTPEILGEGDKECKTEEVLTSPRSRAPTAGREQVRTEVNVLTIAHCY